MQFLNGLNPQQKQAVTAPNGPTLILAGPGSGKTRVLTQRIAYLVGQVGVPPHRILAVTFTNKAAREMKSRVEVLLDGKLRGLLVGTFHAICARFLRREAKLLPVNSDFVIFDTNDQESLIKQILRELNLDEKKFRPSSMLDKISSAKNELIGPDEFVASTYGAEITQRIYARYQALLIQNNALDFDDLLVMTVKLLQNNKDVRDRYQGAYDHVLVDEFQDTNTAQYALLRLLAGKSRNLYAVGDPDQSVYKWRGADYRNVNKLKKDYADAHEILLEQNYRSTQTILDAAMAVIDQHPGRTRKQLFSDRKGGLKIKLFEAYNEMEEAQFIIDELAKLAAMGINPGDCAVMYRTNAQSRAVEEAFIRARLPYKLVGAQRFYGRKEIKDIVAYLRLIHNPADTVSLFRIINTPTRGIGAKSLEQLQVAANAAQITAVEVLKDLGEAGPHSVFAKGFGAKAAASLANFGVMLSHWQSAKSEVTVAQLIDVVCERIGYREYLRDGTEEGNDRWENVLELRGAAKEDEAVTLGEFLQDVTLVADQDTIEETAKAPTLLTLHAAKGLEFGIVFIVGLDEGVLPHQRSFDDSESMLEERRLFYVGMTRAKDRLYILRAFRRTMYGDSALSEPSRFLEDLPAHLIDGQLPGRSKAGGTSYQAPSNVRIQQRVTTWDPSPRPKLTLSPLNAPPAKYKVGQRVKHPKYGEGMVVDSHMSSGEEEVTVAFEAVGVKRFVASVAPLELLKG